MEKERIVSFNLNFSGSNGRHITHDLAGNPHTVKMRRQVSPVDRFCCQCGSKIPAKEQHYTADVYRLHPACGQVERVLKEEAQ